MYTNGMEVLCQLAIVHVLSYSLFTLLILHFILCTAHTLKVLNPLQVQPLRIHYDEIHNKSPSLHPLQVVHQATKSKFNT